MDLASILAGAKQMGGDSMAGFSAGRNTGQAQPSMDASPLLAALMGTPGAVDVLGMLPGGQSMDVLRGINTPEVRHELDPSRAYMTGRIAGAGTRKAQDLAEAITPENIGNVAGQAFGTVEGLMDQGGQALESAMPDLMGGKGPLYNVGGGIADAGDAVLDSLFDAGQSMKGGFQQGRTESLENVDAQIQKLQELREQMTAGATQLGRVNDLRKSLEGGPIDAIGGIGTYVKDSFTGGPDAPQPQTPSEAELLLQQATDAGKGAIGGVGDAIGGALGGAKDAIGGMAGNVMDSISGPLAPYTGGAEHQAIGGMSPTTIQHLRQILSPQELEAVMQDPQKMAEIEALMQQQGLMGGQ